MTVRRASPEENKALLDALMSGQVSSIFEKLRRDEAPRARWGEVKGVDLAVAATARAVTRSG